MQQSVQVLGSLLVLAAFVAVQRGRWSPTSRVYLALNTVGSTVLAVDAFHGTQWGFLLLEGVWALVSGAGLVRSGRAAAGATRGVRAGDGALTSRRWATSRVRGDATPATPGRQPPSDVSGIVPRRGAPMDPHARPSPRAVLSVEDVEAVFVSRPARVDCDAAAECVALGPALGRADTDAGHHHGTAACADGGTSHAGSPPSLPLTAAAALVAARAGRELLDADLARTRGDIEHLKRAWRPVTPSVSPWGC